MCRARSAAHPESFPFRGYVPGICAARDGPRSVVEEVWYACFEMDAAVAYGYARGLAEMPPFANRTVELATYFPMCGHGLYKSWCGISQESLTEARIPTWF